MATLAASVRVSPTHAAIAGAALCAALATPFGARAQVSGPLGFSSLPSFAWTPPGASPEATNWDGSYARMSTGFQVSSSKRFGTSAGPTVGFEGGKLWREGDVVYGVLGAVDYMSPFGRYGSPGPGAINYSRDFAGALQFKSGVLVAPDVLVYSKLGVSAVNETLRFGGTPASLPFSRSDIAVRPDARVGVEWQVNDRLSVGVEMGVAGPGVR